MVQLIRSTEAATGDVLSEKVFLEILQNSKENTCTCNFIKKETLTQMFSCEFCEISKNTFFTEHLWVTASRSIYDQFIVLNLYF